MRNTRGILSMAMLALSNGNTPAIEMPKGMRVNASYKPSRKSSKGFFSANLYKKRKALRRQQKQARKRCR
jgi:hypothetical protein